MRIENLSNHAGEILQGSEDQVRRALHDLSQAQSRHAEAQAELEAARKRKPWWKRMLAIPSPEEKEARGLLEAAKQQHLYADAVRRQSGHRVQQRAAGVQGEQELASWLSAELPDDWSGFGGYQNRRGEADLVLVGPPGVWVIEVKNRNVRLRVDGDRWLYDKLDKWGNVVEPLRPATDNAQRSWGRQAGDVGDSLVWWLERNHHTVPVRTAVMLVHPRASISSVRDAGVDLVSADPHELLRAMTSAPSVIGPDERAAIVALIRRDHVHHKERRQQRS